MKPVFGNQRHDTQLYRVTVRGHANVNGQWPLLCLVHHIEWVATNRDVVEKDTKGEIAYVHIRSMDQPSLVRFHNEIDRFSNKKGIIVDIRYNGGGNIDQEIIDILERQPYQFWN